ncbi:DUF6255 family natural product biosynthesis protein [Streptomyces sp. NPDC046261]|uniref:DUF6255 family natural product biosynthesis protein n=1 Tax=Streptomyces sp. NPDC046261 TaxID=3157200 RepID=UPI0033D5C8E4
MTGRWAGTAYAAARPATLCAHSAGWTRSGGEAHCDRCGVRRFTDYGAVRPAGLPHAIVPSPREPEAADRAAAWNLCTRP